MCWKCGQEEDPLAIHFLSAQLWLGIELRSSVLHGYRRWILRGPQSGMFWLQYYWQDSVKGQLGAYKGPSSGVSACGD
jgi:hypothetical protein